MILEVKKLIAHKQYVGNFSFNYTPEQDKLLVPLCSVIGEVKVEGEYEIYEDDAVGIDIRLSYKLKGQCSYCLDEAEKSVDYAAEILFVKDKDDIDNYYYDGTKLDLSVAVEDAFIFSQPNVILCKEGCEGVKIDQR